MKPSRIGIVGAGFNPAFHVEALQSVRGAELAGIYANRPDRALELIEKANTTGVSIFGGAIFYDSIIELCKNVDVVAICSPNFARIETMEAILQAIQEGAALKGIICEKPLGRTYGEALRVTQIAGQCRGINGVCTAYFENQIFMPTEQKCREQLVGVTAQMGSPVLARTAEEHGGPHGPWFWDPRKSGGGVWNDMGCHSVAVGQYLLTPHGMPIHTMEPVSVSANLRLLKWGQKRWTEELEKKYSVKFGDAPAEDFANVTITFRNTETGEKVDLIATDSWMFAAPGLRLSIEAMGPGYNMVVNTLNSPSGIFISDYAAASIANSEAALEKSEASRGSLIVQPNEPGLYGYEGEWRDALAAFAKGHDGMLDFDYGLQIAQIVAAGYKSHEERRVINIADVDEEYEPLIFLGQGAKVLN